MSSDTYIFFTKQAPRLHMNKLQTKHNLPFICIMVYISWVCPSWFREG